VKVVDARWVFSSGADDSTQAILYQNNREQIVKKLNDPEGRTALELSIATEKRFKEQKATPGTEAALRRLIEAVAAGKPNYEEMTPKFAETIRPLASALQATLKDLGALQSLTFTDVRPAGSDTYDAKFENATRKITIRLSSDGLIDTSVLWP
jgi:hypothetical protein